MDQEKEFNKIHTWIVHKGYHLIVDSKIDNGIDHKSKIISLNSRYNKTDKIYILLHECGHLLALSNKKSKFFLLKDSFEEGSASFKVFRIEEEIDAWNRAKVLAKRLNIPIEDDKWEEMFSAAILKYIKWAAK